MEQWQQKKLNQVAARLEATNKLTAKEYCEREGLTDKSYLEHAQAVQLGGTQSQVNELLFYLKQFGVIEK